MNAASKKQYTEIGRKMRAIPPEKPASNYKWEERCATRTMPDFMI